MYNAVRGKVSKKKNYVKIAIILLGSYEYMPNAGKTSYNFQKNEKKNS